MKVALAQINPTIGDFSGNIRRIVKASRQAAERGARLVAFPELAVTGYPPRDLLEKSTFVDCSIDAVQEIANETAGLACALVVGYVDRSSRPEGKPLTNSAALIEAGTIRGRQDKMLLPTYDVFDEARHFEPGDLQLVWEVAGRQVGVAICEDSWNDKHFWPRPLYERDPVVELAAQDARFLLSINASPFSINHRQTRRRIFQTLTQRYQRPMLYVNQVGGNDQLIFDGSSFVLNAQGEVAASAASFAEDLILWDSETGEGDLRENLPDPEEAVYEALVLGTRDYLRKCGFTKVLIGLSGGMDSSLTAAIAVDAVGRENVTGVAMPGPYSSGHSLEDAERLAHNLGIRLEVLPISAGYEVILKTLQPLFHGSALGVAEENLQSRLRGITLMALSNEWGAIVLTTGNKSEMAVGYCTLYGDMSGGLAVISDVPKTLVYRLARVANRRHPNAIPERVFDKPPSAELRPDQKDTDSLPEYQILDRILEGYIEHLLSPREIAQKHGLDPDLVRKYVNMVDRNEYKREQAAPGLRVTTKAFGLGRRLPIAQRFSE